MQNEGNKFTTPVGRLVQGSLYVPADKDAVGKPFDDGRVQYWCHVAIPKQGEAHWNQTEWGAYLWNFVQTDFGNSKIPPNFAWKVSDGDDATPDEKGRRVCDRAGYAGCWIIKPKNGFAAHLHDCTKPGKPIMADGDEILPGDWVQVRLEMMVNKGTNPSVYLNHSKVGFIKHGERIHTYSVEDVNAVGFMDAPPSTPMAAMGTTPAPTTQPAAAAAPPAMPVTPHTGILMPTAPGQQAAPPPPAAPPAAPVKVMTALANGTPYESFIQNRWTDQMLLDHGYMVMQ